MKLSRRQLQKALDDTAAAYRKAFLAEEKIVNHCLAVYGLAPGDIDNDQYIDGCTNGCGMPTGMTVDKFEKSMLDAGAQQGEGEQA